MSSDIIFILCIVAVVIAILILKKISSILKTVLIFILLVVGSIGYIILVPTSPVSIWVTDNIASLVKLDAEGKYEDGDIIFTYELNAGENSNITEETESDASSSLQEVSGALNGLLADRIVAIADEYIELQESYTLTFSDSYLIMTPVDLSLTIEIIKGELVEDE